MQANFCSPEWFVESHQTQLRARYFHQNRSTLQGPAAGRGLSIRRSLASRVIAAVIAHGQPARGESQHVAPVLAGGDASGVLLAMRAGAAVGVHLANFAQLLGQRISAHAAGATGDDSLEGELLPLAVLQFGLSRAYADRPALEGANVERRHVPVRPRSLQVDGVPPGAVADHPVAHGRAYRVERLGQAFDVIVVRGAEPSPAVWRDDGWFELDRFDRRLGA